MLCKSLIINEIFIRFMIFFLIFSLFLIKLLNTGNSVIIKTIINAFFVKKKQLKKDELMIKSI